MAMLLNGESLVNTDIAAQRRFDMRRINSTIV
jgi:hypothetical protein